jgi:NTP pyrophosphatase (non-canonical NTP hydrolase)
MTAPNMNLTTYQNLAMRTAKELPFTEAMCHAALGLSSEAGEYATAVKANIVYGRPLDEANIFEELGDVLWFVAYAAATHGYALEDVALNNIQKLQKRFPERYSDSCANARADKTEGQV